MAKKTACEGHCGKLYWKKEMGFGPDPYASEIGGDDTPVWLCSECYHALALEI